MAKRSDLGRGNTVGALNGAVIGWAAFALVCAALALASDVLMRKVADGYARLSLAAAAQQAPGQQMTLAAGAAVAGDPGAFDRLRAERDQVQRGMDALPAGSAAEGLSASLARVEPHLRAAQTAWIAYRGTADRILDAQADLLGMRDLIQSTAALLPDVGAAMTRSAELIVAEGAPAGQAWEAGRQLARLQAMNAGLERLLVGGQPGSVAGDADDAVTKEFTVHLEALTAQAGTRGATATRDALAQTALLWTAMRTGVDALRELVPRALPAIDALAPLQEAGSAFATALDTLAAAGREAPLEARVGPLPVGPWAVPLFTALALAGLIALGVRVVSDARRRVAAALAQSGCDEQAILRLLDEMGNLADGDLTVTATVTEDKTGAIADSVNFAVEALRGLVATINATAAKVAQASQESRTIAVRLTEAAAAQAAQITLASGAIRSLTEQINQVANNAIESAEVASRSLQVAGRGARTVRDTIAGMDAIREQIQETAKRIKRLGESSQEIGEIVELIDDIADQTNILALNAAMQAAMAGDAGRGFAVVADEVQRLAERSRNATKQIEVLVRTIQADTNEAVSSMEASTAGVVEGANLAENAGEALREIENVSAYIADLTKRIADSSALQSDQSAEINATVQAIRGITEENADGTRRAAAAVEELVSLVTELQRSVAGFRLS
ncbi:MAG: methyl-accepting chemotaxis protein [Lamprocystis purpurea]|jgi:twitching motility protein PilJ|uniref:methyl-accepting chemotaxis protein n=1 Tax=Lamprocystis purpurea TaxID=61598 RepID=UPI000363C50C|nr:methyl-accepting chemotaxis protein [Lamprocystis purpurea]MBV5272654.1 methyl-accepting chemotaxis protein [Lamprocystis purpurea]